MPYGILFKINQEYVGWYSHNFTLSTDLVIIFFGLNCFNQKTFRNIKKLVIFRFKLLSSGVVEDTTLEAKAKDRLFEKDPLDAKDRNSRGQGPRTQLF